MMTDDHNDEQVFIYDTTLRDGCQAEGVALTLEDKLEIALKLDQLGVHYIEGGYPLSNPKDQQFFERVPQIGLKQAKVAAFGSTRKAGNKAEEDTWLRVVLEAETPVVTLVAKGWDAHVTQILRTDLDENLRMVQDSVRYMVSMGREVVLDIEHFFDGCIANREYALKVAQVAAEFGASCICLCDTNGGVISSDIVEMTRAVVASVDCCVGIHCHNDCGMAVASTILAVQAGARHVQGTLNGLGERSGNADLCSIIPVLNLKTPYRAIPEERLSDLTEVSRYAYEAANLMFLQNQPFVGPSAFAHKGGLHADAMRKAEFAYEHIKPELVGNERRFLISELSGTAGMKDKLEKFGIDCDRDTLKHLLERLQDMEHKGYQFEAAEASFELLVRRIVNNYKPPFSVESYHTDSRQAGQGESATDATVKVRVGGELMHTAGEGDGPVNALDVALRKALEPHFPVLADLHLTDYRVRVINPKNATAARVRVIIQSADSHHIWGTTGVHENIIEASWQALRDSVEYKLLKG